MEKNKILSAVDHYYSEKIRNFGATPAGVDWNSVDSQELRFSQLLKIIDQSKDHFSLLDYGCGYGSLYDYIRRYFANFNFTGFDISKEMIIEAEKKFSSGKSLKWISTVDQLDTHDYLIASGIFNVRNQFTDDEWLSYILDTLNQMNSLSKFGFSFNILTAYSDKDKMRDYLFYADPLFFFDYCKKKFSKQVALLHDYPIYEFTILVRK